MSNLNIERPNGVAPSTSRYAVGAKGGMVAQAWQYIWDRLNHEDFKDAHALCNEAAGVFKILPSSIMSHLHRMAAEGILEAQGVPTKTVVSRGGAEHEATRRRTHFRIAEAKSDRKAPPVANPPSPDHPMRDGLRVNPARYGRVTGVEEQKVEREIGDRK